MKIKIKNAGVSPPENQMPFEFTLTTDKDKVKIQP